MMSGKRKTPVLLRRAPMSGAVNVLTNYRRGEVNGKDMITVVGEGKHDVTAAFYELMLTELMNDGCEAIIEQLHGAALGLGLDKKDRAEIGLFRSRLVKIVEAHNARVERGELKDA